MRSISIVTALLLCLFCMAPLANAQPSDEQIQKLQAQIDELQKQLNELKKGREADKAEIKTLKEAKEAVSGAEGLFAKNTGIMITGYMDVGFEDTQNGSSTFDNHHFNPIFLGQFGDNLLFEAEVEYEHAGTEIAVEYATLDYIMNDYLTLLAGKFLVPFGVYNERLHPSWIAKMPTRPLPMNNIVPVGWSDVGVQLKGATSLAQGLKACSLVENVDLEYSAYVANGLEGTDGAGIRGLRGGSVMDDNNNKAIGGRLALRLLPGFELGGSAYHGAYTADGNQDITMWGLDGAMWWDLFELRSEWVNLKQEATPTDLDKTGFYFQGAYKLAAVPVPYINQTEIVGRYGRAYIQSMTGHDADSHTYSLGLNYYIKPSFVWKNGYDWNEEDTGASTKNNAFTSQFSYGF